MRVIKAFTLAEVLITLTIIGVVAALTIPALMTNIQDAQLKTAWRRAYSVSAQAYKRAVLDNGNIGYGQYACGSYTKWNALKKNLNVVKTCSGSTFGNCWVAGGVQYTGSCGGFNPSNQNSSEAFVTADGMYWLLYHGPCDIVFIDVNGTQGPNQLGKDVFVLDMNDTTIDPENGGCSGYSNIAINLLLN